MKFSEAVNFVYGISRTKFYHILCQMTDGKENPLEYEEKILESQIEDLTPKFFQDLFQTAKVTKNVGQKTITELYRALESAGADLSLIPGHSIAHRHEPIKIKKDHNYWSGVCKRCNRTIAARWGIIGKDGKREK